MNVEAKNAMLRIAIHRTPDVDTWTLQGRLTGRMVDELTVTWKNGRGERSGHRIVIDLIDVTSVDERGEKALMEIMREGATFVVRGLYSKELLEGLKHRCEQEA